MNIFLKDSGLYIQPLRSNDDKQHVTEVSDRDRIEFSKSSKLINQSRFL